MAKRPFALKIKEMVFKLVEICFGKRKQPILRYVRGFLCLMGQHFQRTVQCLSIITRKLTLCEEWLSSIRQGSIKTRKYVVCQAALKLKPSSTVN